MIDDRCPLCSHIMIHGGYGHICTNLNCLNCGRILTHIGQLEDRDEETKD